MLSLELSLKNFERRWLAVVGLLAACGPQPAATSGTDGTTGDEPSSTASSAPTSSPTDPTPDVPPECVDDDDCGLWSFCSEGMCYPSHAPPCYYEECCYDFDCLDGGSCEDYVCNDEEQPEPQPRPIVLPPCAPAQPDISEWELTQTPSALGLADVDGDGDLDIFAALPAAAAIELAFNDGAGSFTPGELVDLGPPQSDLRAAAADLDGDGDIDLAVARADTGDVLVLFGQDGVFTPGPLLPTAAPAATIAAVDLDDDGDIDLTTFGGGPDQLSVWVGDGLGNFVEQQPLVDLGGGTVTAVERVNFDALPDLLVLPPEGSDEPLKLYHGAADLSWQFHEPFPLDAIEWSQALTGDLGNTAHVELVVLRRKGDGGRVRVWGRAADLVWDGAQDYLTASPLAGGALAEVTADSSRDLVAATSDSTISVLVGAPGAVFTCERIHPVAGAAARELLVTGELDGDPGSEVVVGSRDGPTVTVFGSL